MKNHTDWPTNQVEIDARLATHKGPVPHFVIDDDSGEPWQLIGSARDISLAAQNIQASVMVAIEEMLGGRLDVVVLSLRRQDMTDEEVAALPVL
ncbi:hypothetical protein LCGC14_2328260 [marine sediment metagenome]|uniref:Uncharacterized protein n=1 Tax=marine sediment metagenome TaxID=412755 RepID=A0A0F9CGC0_9ZZZZ